MPYLDLHCHILPGLDDGAVDLEETVAMLRLAWEGGTRTVVATPHLHSPYFDHLSADRIREAYDETRRAVIERSSLPGYEFLTEIDLLLGAENHLTADLLESAESGDALTLADTTSLLVEPSPFVSGAIVESSLDRLCDLGYRPVLAHVERYEIFRRTPRQLFRLVEKGCVAQVNAGSILGSEGGEIRRASLDLLSRGLVDIVASDGHGVDRRKPDLGRAADLLASRYNPSAVGSWFEEKPTELLCRPTKADKGEDLVGRIG